MTNILFSHSYFYRFDSKQWEDKRPYPPLMTIQAAALIREKGYNVQLFDTALAKSANELEPHLKSFTPKYFVVILCNGLFEVNFSSSPLSKYKPLQETQISVSTDQIPFFKILFSRPTKQ